MANAYEQWIGREEKRSERIASSSIQAMAATLDLETAPAAGQALPPGWQWLFFNPVAKRSGLGNDGHPRTGDFLPPIELPRRMWAGSRIRYLAGVRIEATATKTSRIAKVENKVGKSGSLWFATVEHSIFSDGAVRIVEEQDIVYRAEAPPATRRAAPQDAYPRDARWTRRVLPDTTLLFRYSALTFNGHRIHYDQAYAREEEGYPDLVVHGPLTATLLQQFALEHGAGRTLSSFQFRSVTPLFVNRAFQLEGEQAQNDALDLWVRGPDGELAMSAVATFK